MSWAAGRRTFIMAIIGIIVVFVVAVTLIAALYKAPSCHDGVKNEGEQGIDCGGPCARLCSGEAQVPSVRFTQAVSPGYHETDIIAYVDNPNVDAEAVNVPYSVTLYGADNALVGTTQGTLDLAPDATTPVFIANVNTGNEPVAEAFLSIDPSQITWYTSADNRLLPQVGSPVIGGTASSPHISVTLKNSATTPIAQLPVVATVFDTAGNVIAASATIVPMIPGQGSAVATFTWNLPFSELPARIDILPVVPPILP